MAISNQSRNPKISDPAVVQSLAQDLGVTEDEVADAFERTMARLEPNSRIKSFLAVIAAHQVRIAYLERRNLEPQVTRTH